MIVGTYVYYCKYIILAYIISRRRDVAGRDKGSKKVKKKKREKEEEAFSSYAAQLHDITIS